MYLHNMKFFTPTLGFSTIRFSHLVPIHVKPRSRQFQMRTFAVAATTLSKVKRFWDIEGKGIAPPGSVGRIYLFRQKKNANFFFYKKMVKF